MNTTTLAHQFALSFPQYIDTLILLAPPSLLKMRIAFIFRGLFANLLPTTLFARKFLNYISSRGSEFPEHSVQAFVIQVQAYKLNTMKLPIISDYDLARLPSRTLLLLGEDEVLYDAEKVASRVRSIAPFVTIAIIAKAKHMVSVDQPDLVNERIIQFAS
ncbi:MAG: alpha/beta hydrolase [Tatlockia sp.]|nr:alpha/beta hydrolase [Tatlockia sp.]